MQYAKILSFIWTYVFPVLKDIYEILSIGTFSYILDRVEIANTEDITGLEKRYKVYEEAREWLEEKNVDLETVSSVTIYLLIELAVAKAKKDRNKLIKRNSLTYLANSSSIFKK